PVARDRPCAQHGKMNSLEELQYPIGRFQWDVEPTPALRAEWIAAIASTPQRLGDAVAGLTTEQLDTPYRPGGWSVRQVVHHYADDHMNSYVRFKLALTEYAPMIKGYSEPAWAELADARAGDVTPSLALLGALHRRWVYGFESLKEGDWR